MVHVILQKRNEKHKSCRDSQSKSVNLSSLIEPQRILLIEENDYKWVENIKEELFEKKSGTVWLVAEKTRMSGIVGLVKCLLREPGRERVRCIFISPTKAGNGPPPFSIENPFYAPLFTKDLVMNVWRDGAWGSFRHIQIRKGVDIVLNSLSDDKFHASMRCVARNGCFVEIGKYDILMDHEIGLKLFSKSRSFIGVDLDTFFNEAGEKEAETLGEITNLVSNGIKAGVVKPLDRTVFDKNSPEEAFRYITKGIHTGKVLIKIRDEEKKLLTVPRCLPQLAVPDTLFYYNKVYIIIGGLGGFGTEVAKWIIKKGGRNLILTSRYGARTAHHYFCLKIWEEQGINVKVSTLNVVFKNEAEKLLEEASRTGPVGGIFNSALVLRDAFMSDQTAESFQEVCDPKAVATKNLDELSRKLCPSLDHFVCFSSISCGRGNAGQTNYGFANSVMEMVCEQRKRDGLP
ncbi:Fatty acid synthase, partial [Araneus ventricosus]